MKKTPCSSYQKNHLIGSFPSPGAPNYREKGAVISSQKGWSSERVAKASSSSIRRHTMSGLTPFFSAGGRTMPSKWDEAERWICSPVSSSSADVRQPHQRRPKSISGPIVDHGQQGGPQVAACYYSNNHAYSPSSSNSMVPIRQGLVVRNLVVGSPFSTGVLAPLAVSVHHYDDAYHFGDGMDSSGSPLLHAAPLCPQHSYHPSSPICQDLLDKNHDEDDMMFSKCDKGTQMSPADETESDLHSSPESCTGSAMVQPGCHSPKLEVRDVQVDSQATLIRGSKRHATKSLSSHKEFRENSTETSQFSPWDIEDSASDISKLKREEAKIIAWENLQKAKAEAAIRKLEMKLEKKRSSSMDKILSKLRKAETKAENMRSSIPEQQENRTSKNCKVFSFPIWSPISCFSTHAVAD
ncbi:uncharacterized protein LOC130942899 [Arachis stenosperma]|uniref:uncharacterized protein LOC130942899 n=1 Tax=Arachis stenosperma TaxID=217475 RepID=UPI0025AC571B|nr:uncharacterized protein LOC130942899 [Arachis stenosperma]